jgi:hypothetical protein
MERVGARLWIARIMITWSEPLAQPSPDRVKGNTHTITRKAVVGIDAPLTAGTLSGVGSASRPLSPITSDGPVTGNGATGSRQA